MAATLELQDINGHTRLAKCLVDPSSNQLGYLETLLNGYNGSAVNRADVSPANTARSTATQVLCVQVLDATGAVFSGGGAVTLANVEGADGATAPTNTLQVGGKDGSGNLQTFLTDASGNLSVILSGGGVVLTNVEAADGAAAPTNTVQVGGKDGSGNLQTFLTDTAGNLSIVFGAARPGEDVANDEVKVKINHLAGWTPAATTGTAVDSAGGGMIGDIVLAATQVLEYRGLTVGVYNAGGGSGDDLDRIIVFGSVDGTNYGVIHDTGTGIAWATGAPGTGDGVWLYQIENNSYNYIRVEALCGAGDDTTVDAAVCGN